MHRSTLSCGLHLHNYCPPVMVGYVRLILDTLLQWPVLWSTRPVAKRASRHVRTVSRGQARNPDLGGLWINDCYWFGSTKEINTRTVINSTYCYFRGEKAISLLFLLKSLSLTTVITFVYLANKRKRECVCVCVCVSVCVCVCVCVCAVSYTHLTLPTRR